jgi:hypothetical protein
VFTATTATGSSTEWAPLFANGYVSLSIFPASVSGRFSFKSSEYYLRAHELAYMNIVLTFAQFQIVNALFSATKMETKYIERLD